MTIAKKVEVRDFWYSLQDLVGGVLPESKRVELEKLIGQVEEEAKNGCPPHNFTPHQYQGGWGATTPTPNMKCIKCLATEYF